MNTPDWKDALPSPPRGGELQEAWMTSFERPDASLLVEHLLPSLLGANHSLSQDLKERNLFFGELGTALKMLHNRLTIVSSPPHNPREDSQYPWIWRYVSHFNVGAQASAVQHAKLWAFHWMVENEEFIELHVSSTNLTMSAFKDQLQAGWRVILPLEKQATLKTRRTWGELISFLEALGASAGKTAADRLERLVMLLGRVECPSDIAFIASIPGQRSAARQFARLGLNPSEVHIFTPTIGEWSDETINQWSEDIGVSPEKLHLKWIATSHPWASSGWALSQNACQTLVRKKVKVECFSNDDRLTKDHHTDDERWSHAKLYLLRKGKQRWVVVTSANWSPAAWGAGNRPPKNFELGVVFRSDWTRLEAVTGTFPTEPYLTESQHEPEESKLQWAEARWDGKNIELCARSNDVTSINALLKFTDGMKKKAALVGRKASMPWSNADCIPFSVCFIQGEESLTVDVIDNRSQSEFAKTALPEVDPAIEQALREAFLLQRYGGPVVGSEPIPGLDGKGKRKPTNAATSIADYAVQAWIDARDAFRVVDKWQETLDKATEDQIVERIRTDGEELLAIFYKQRAEPYAELAAEELGWRLTEEK